MQNQKPAKRPADGARAIAPLEVHQLNISRHLRAAETAGHEAKVEICRKLLQMLERQELAERFIKPGKQFTAETHEQIEELRAQETLSHAAAIRRGDPYEIACSEAALAIADSLARIRRSQSAEVPTQDAGRATTEKPIPRKGHKAWLVAERVGLNHETVAALDAYMTRYRTIYPDVKGWGTRSDQRRARHRRKMILNEITQRACEALLNCPSSAGVSYLGFHVVPLSNTKPKARRAYPALKLFVPNATPNASECGELIQFPAPQKRTQSPRPA